MSRFICELPQEQLEKVEKLVNEQITKDLVVYTQEVPQEKALKIVSLRSVLCKALKSKKKT